MGAYEDAGPVSGNVPPIVMFFAVTPGAAAFVAAVPPVAVRASTLASASPRSNPFRMQTPLRGAETGRAYRPLTMSAK